MIDIKAIKGEINVISCKNTKWLPYFHGNPAFVATMQQ